MATLAAAIVGVIVVNGNFSFWQEYRAERMLAELARLLPPMTKVVRDGAVATLPSESLVPGDVIAVEQGDLVPADCRLIDAFALRVSNATVTGESMPVARSAAPSDAAEALRSPNVLLAGTTVVSGEGRAVVYATGRNTEFGRIARLTQAGGEVRTPFLQEIAFVTRMIAAFAIGLGAVFFFAGREAGLSSWDASLFGVASSSPMSPRVCCRRSPSRWRWVPAGWRSGKVLIRHLPAVETWARPQ